MDINQIGTLEVIDDYRQINRRMTKALERLGTGVKATSPKEDPVLWGDIQGLKTAAGKLQAYSENLHRGASSVRIALSAMETSKVHLQELKGVLQSAQDAPEGSKARASALQQYNDIHKLVNDFAAPQDLGARKLLDDPSRFPSAGKLEIAAGENGFEIVLQTRPIHTGAGGLDLPKAGEPLPSDPTSPPAIANLENATDEEVQLMIEHLERSLGRLLENTEALVLDASSIERTTNFNTALINRNEASVNALNIPDLEAEAVLAQSLSVRNSVALFGLTGFNETKRLALSLLQ